MRRGLVSGNETTRFLEFQTLRMKSFLPLVLAILLSVQSAYPWGGDGHRAIADAAKGMLTPQAKSSVEKILGNDDLASIST